MSADQKRHRILIVDDSGLQREILKEMVESEGYEVATAEGGLEAIAAAYADAPDVVVSDVMMPEMSGYHLCRFIKNDRLLQNTPVILLTSSALNKQDRFWGLKSGADAYLPKEENPRALFEKIADFVAKAAPFEAEKATRKKAGKKQAAAPVKSSLTLLLDKLLFESTVASEIKRLGEYVHDLDKLFAELASLIDSFMEYSAIGVAILAAPRPHIYVNLKHRLGMHGMRSLKLALAQEATNADFTARCREPDESGLDMRIFPRDTYDATWAEPDNVQFLSEPLKVRDEVHGSICIALRDAGAGDESMRANFALTAREFAPVARTLFFYEEARRLAVSDSLTGLYNHRYFLNILDDEFKKFKNYGNRFAVFMMDIDRFTQFSEQYGPKAADKLQVEVARVLSKSVRGIDVAARYGGDSFVVLLPEMSGDQAISLCERIRLDIQGRVFNLAEGRFSTTCSFGVSETSPSCNFNFELVRAAVKAVSQAKEAGGNCIRVFR